MALAHIPSTGLDCWPASLETCAGLHSFSHRCACWQRWKLLHDVRLCCHTDKVSCLQKRRVAARMQRRALDTQSTQPGRVDTTHAAHCEPQHSAAPLAEPVTSTTLPTPFPDLLLGRLIGRGSYGRVHVSLYQGREVSVEARSPARGPCRRLRWCLCSHSAGPCAACMQSPVSGRASRGRWRSL